LLEHLDAGPAVILGNSFAAGSALWAAHDAPAGPWRIWFWTTYWNSLFPTHKPLDHAQVKSAITRNLKEPGRMAALRIMVNLSKADTEAMLPGSRAPALIAFIEGLGQPAT
jgi:hypothetical protein